MKNYFKILFIALISVIGLVSCLTTEETQRIKIAPTEKVEIAPVQDTIYESVQEYNHTSQNENHTNRNIGFGLMFFAMAATSVNIRVGGFKAFWTNFIFSSAEKIAEQFLDKFKYDYMILFTVAKKLILALVDKDPNNGAQVQAIFEEHGDDLVKLLFQIFGDRLAAKFAKNTHLSEEEKQMALAQKEVMQLTYDNAESSDFSNVLATALLEKKSEYPNLHNLTNPTV
ncbi:hypothetical protein V9L05_19955 [Bernardetia sp. Wsw4-3y2]|uniref:hypothetical protein n=1 Tax=Bernardetia sp. Wsw4-3y2 TaxID=3127471 RepID=UPI0030D24450